MKIGYARVSTDEQNLDLQLDALKAAGCDKIFTDEGISGITKDRDGLTQALSAVAEGNTPRLGHPRASSVLFRGIHI